MQEGRFTCPLPRWISMKLWIVLYTMIWVALIEFLLVMTPGDSLVLMYLHSVLGVVIIGIAFYNFSGIRKTRVMGRVKRIAKASFNISVAAGISGVLIFFDIHDFDILKGHPPIPMLSRHLHPLKGVMRKSG